MPSNKTTKEEREKAVAEALSDTTPEDPNEVEETPEEVVEETTEEKPVETVEEKQELPTIEERYKESTRESQVLFAKQKKFNETVEKASQLPEPTEGELRDAYQTWDDMTETEKMLAKDNLINKRKFEMVHQATLEGKKIEEWAEKVDSFITTDATKFPKLAGKEEAFKSFCLKPTRRGLELEDLVKLYLYDLPEPTQGHKGSLLQTGTGGNAAKPKPDTIGADEAALLRKTDHKKYQKYIREGKIKIDF